MFFYRCLSALKSLLFLGDHKPHVGTIAHKVGLFLSRALIFTAEPPDFGVSFFLFSIFFFFLRMYICSFSCEIIRIFAHP